MKKAVIFLIWMFPALAAANSNEIAHLLHFIERSGCTFERNNSQYDAREARKHIQNKYDYLEGRIKSAEDFIRYTATKSSMSGKAYTVTCEDKQMTSADWLKDELERFRSNSN